MQTKHPHLTSQPFIATQAGVRIVRTRNTPRNGQLGLGCLLWVCVAIAPLVLYILAH